jgi:hypothetical protein
VAISRAGVRNKVQVVFTDAATGARSTHVEEDAASQTKFGLRFMEVAEDFSSNIDSDAEADALATAQKNLADAQASGVVDTNNLQLAVLNAQGKYDGYTKSVQGASGGIIDHSTKLGELRGDLDEVNAALDTNAAAHEEQTRRILFGILQQRLATDGFSEQEALYLTGVAERWGLVDKATADATRGIIEGVAEAEKSGNWEKLDTRLDNMADKYDGGPGSVTYAVKQSAGAMAAMADDEVMAPLDTLTGKVGTLADTAADARDRIGETGDALLALPDSKTITLTTEHRDSYPVYEPGQGTGGTHFASGGTARGGAVARIGERGPEAIIPGADSTILTTEQLRALESLISTMSRTRVPGAATPGASPATAASGGGTGTALQIIQNFYGPANPPEVRKASEQGVRALLRAEGRS